jgi:hypothetical protein
MYGDTIIRISVLLATLPLIAMLVDATRKAF